MLLAGPGAVQAQETLLTLQEAVALALSRNFDIRIARNDAVIAGNNYARGHAGFLPTFGLTARQSRTASRFGGDSFTANTVDLAAGAGITLFEGKGRFAAYERLGVLREQGLLAAERTAEGTLAEVVVRYYDLARLQQQREVLQEAIAISEERLRIAELRRDLGSASELEVRRAQVDLNTDRAALLRLQTTLITARAAFDELLGREGRASYRVDDRIVVNPTLTLAALEGAALAQNRALRLSEQNRQVARLLYREEQAAWWPRLDLQVGYALNALPAEIGLPVSRPGGLTYSLNAAFDVFDGFNRRRRVENARLAIENARLAQEQLRTRVQTDVASAYATYRNSLDLMALEEENVSLATQNVEVALERFRLGTITSVELREVQTALTNNESRLITARFEAKRAEIDLLELSGRLLDVLRP